MFIRSKGDRKVVEVKRNGKVVISIEERKVERILDAFKSLTNDQQKSFLSRASILGVS